MSVTATSRVATERGERYRKQLASHFGSKIEVVEEPAGTVLKWGFGGSTTLTVEASALVMRADAEDAETLTWTTSVENGRARLYCDTCSRDHLRAIEGKLDSAWW